ncbi:hypothetical protein QYE76_019637 [Lolium multiflorum]|uniref:RNase H type-1 domain-containing protein n=1 Tax=Lolium multiflorum TaxID=4521 RepID=A0AAD8VR61_LOLMU|nr:hypothetical protein QYE76_019637 [Lolium multiflorum]
MPAPRDRNRERTRSNAEAGIKNASLSLVGTKNASLSLVGIKNATLSLAEAKDAIRNQGGAGTRSTHLSHAGAGTTEVTTTKRKGATEAGASRGSHAENPKAEEHLTGPLADLPHHHLEAEVEAEAEAGDLVPAQNHPVVPPVMPGTASTRNLKHYDGSERPDTWIEDYYNAVTFAGGTPNIACRMLQLYLIGPARVWLSDLEENTIFCWLDLKKAFENHFRGTYKRPATTSDLLHPEEGIQASPEAGKGKNKDKEEDSSEAMDEDDASPEPKEGTAANKSNPFGKKSVGTYHTFLGTPTVRAKKSALRILNATVPAVPHMSSGRRKPVPLTGRITRPSSPKSATLWLDPGEDEPHQGTAQARTTEFHGVVPGKKANSLGSIKLPVAFGDVNNYREEMITFEVVPFKSSYHVIFGRPTYHKFHARACYIYNKLKIPGPNGWITVSGDYKKARDCEEGEAAFAESVISGEEESEGYRAAVDPSEMRPPEAISNIHFEATNNMAEYEALLHGLRIAKEIGIKHIICCGDSDLVAQQVAGTWNARNSVMAAYRDEVDEIAKCFLGYEVKYVRRDDTQQTCCPSSDPAGNQFRLEFSLSICEYPQ